MEMRPRKALSSSRLNSARRTMRLLLTAYRACVQLRNIDTIQRIMAKSSRGRRMSGACSIISHRSALSGIPGAAQGEA
jgi:hypothetical protein